VATHARWSHRFLRSLFGWTTSCRAATPDFQDGIGERKNHRAKNQACRAEDGQAADNSEEHGNGMQTQPFADDDRVEQIVDQADDQSAP
jgi:hypothetical protein